MAEIQKIAALQDAIVRFFSNNIDVRWDFLLINIERQEDDNESVTDILEVAFQREGTRWKRISVIAPADHDVFFNDLARLMSTDGKQAWSSCTLEIDSSGKYRFSFSYEPPNRLRGNLDDRSFDNFTPPKLP